MLGGATFLVLADLLARAAAPPTEIPLGIVTAFAGGPLFLLRPQSQIQCQSIFQLPLILEVDRISEVGRLTAGSKLIINTATDNGYAWGKSRQRVKTTCRTGTNIELHINIIAINTGGAPAIVQI